MFQPLEFNDVYNLNDFFKKSFKPLFKNNDNAVLLVEDCVGVGSEVIGLTAAATVPFDGGVVDGDVVGFDVKIPFVGDTTVVRLDKLDVTFDAEVVLTTAVVVLFDDVVVGLGEVGLIIVVVVV